MPAPATATAGRSSSQPWCAGQSCGWTADCSSSASLSTVSSEIRGKRQSGDWDDSQSRPCHATIFSTLVHSSPSLPPPKPPSHKHAHHANHGLAGLPRPDAGVADNCASQSRTPKTRSTARGPQSTAAGSQSARVSGGAGADARCCIDSGEII